MKSDRNPGIADTALLSAALTALFAISAASIRYVFKTGSTEYSDLEQRIFNNTWSMQEQSRRANRLVLVTNRVSDHISSYGNEANLIFTRAIAQPEQQLAKSDHLIEVIRDLSLDTGQLKAFSLTTPDVVSLEANALEEETEALQKFYISAAAYDRHRVGDTQLIASYADVLRSKQFADESLGSADEQMHVMAQSKIDEQSRLSERARSVRIVGGAALAWLACSFLLFPIVLVRVFRGRRQSLGRADLERGSIHLREEPTRLSITRHK